MLEFTIKGHIASLTLNHPGRGNSFGADEAEVLIKILKIKNLAGLILTGAGHRFFCTGGNLAQQAKAKSAKAAMAQQLKIRSALEALDRARFPTVALINGDCFGGGTELLSTFDHVIAAPQAFFGFWQRRLGLSYGWGGGRRLLRRLTEQELRARTLHTKIFTAFEAKRIGLVDDIRELDQFESAAAAWLDTAAKHPSYSELKSWVPSSESKSFSKLWMNETHLRALKKHEN